MDKPTRKALLESIAHWDRIAQGIDIDISAESCPLCARFTNRCQDLVLKSCPVYKKTGLTGCNATPWSTVAGFMAMKKSFGLLPTHIWSTVEQEIEFLISLLPFCERQKFNLSQTLTNKLIRKLACKKVKHTE